MSKQFDFSMPLTDKRYILLKACIARHREMLITKLIHIDLLKYLIQVVAVDVLKEPDKYVNSVDKHTGRLLSILSETVFPFDEANYKHDEFSALKEEYKRYIEYVKRVEAEQEANNNA